MRRPTLSASRRQSRRSFDTWQIIYIDLMTNVMIFFVVLWAIQSRERKSAPPVSYGTETVKMVSLPGDVLFPPGKNALTPEGQAVLEKLFSDEAAARGTGLADARKEPQRGAVLDFDAGPKLKRMLVIHGHTDADGQKDKNLELGFERSLAAYKEIRKYGSDVADHVILCTHADNSAVSQIPKLQGEPSDEERELLRAAKAKNRRITIEDKLLARPEAAGARP
jgi:outer membrane protein OmpA-like peptidoglycan-associated protein